MLEHLTLLQAPQSRNAGFIYNVRMNIKQISTPILIIAAVVLLAVLLVLGRFCSQAATIDVTVNGTPLTIHGAKTMQTAIRESGLPINPGDLISLRGTVLKKSEGYPFAATVNGEETTDPNHMLYNGDVITIEDGKDRVEDYDSEDEVRPRGATIGGSGAICMFESGADGITEVRTGRISGDVVRRMKQEETDAVCTCYDPDVGDDKVIALTFDEGPSEKYTSDILDILRENEARATFFCVGTKVENSTSLVKRERAEGHQVCTNTYDRSWSPDASPDPDAPFDREGLVDEIEHGRQAISDALDGEEASRIARLPDSTLTSSIAGALDSHVDATVSWNLDTGDWMEFNPEEVYEVLMSAKPGDIVLLHDGGGDRSATVEALEKALPRLKSLGYSFVTIDDLMGYPPL